MKRTFWPLVLLALPGCFILWSMHSGAVPIFVPSLWYGSYYNTRYGLAALPLFAVGAAGLVAVVPQRARALLAALVVLGGTVPWLVYPRPEHWIVWQEANVNDEARRQAAREGAAYLALLYQPGEGIFTSFSAKTTPVYRQMGVPLRDTFTGDNGLPWDAAVKRPELFLWQQWALALPGDAVQAAIDHAASYTLEKSITVKGAPAILIYRRTGGNHGTP